MWLKYADKPILLGDWASEQQHGILGAFEKPRGRWITDDSGDCWKAWCLAEQFRLDQLTHKHEVVLDEASMLIIRSLWELDDFAERFGAVNVWGTNEHPTRWRDKCIDWRQVANQYSGVIITPYQWQRRMDEDLRWYYGWDCASGCIWDMAAIKDIRLIEIDTTVLEPKRKLV
jgi:hypothetical protein